MTQEFYYKNTKLYQAPFYIWGIVNLTPDSFHDGGKHFAVKEQENHDKNTSFKCFKKEKPLPSGIIHATKLLQEGAAILDIGGASSRPNAENVPPFEEWNRIQETLAHVVSLKSEYKKDKKQNKISSSCTHIQTQQNNRIAPPKEIIPFSDKAKSHEISNQNNLNTSQPPIISIDTWRAHVAQKALEAGADIINDISAFSWEENLLDIVTEHKAGYVLMHCQGTPKDMQKSPTYHNIVDDVIAFFETKMNKLVQKGLPENHIMLDLGIGFGKNVEHNLTLLKEIEKFHTFNRPILLGISHKSFFGHLLGIEADKRAHITQVCTALLAQKNISHHRVHDVLQTVQSLKLESYIR